MALSVEDVRAEIAASLAGFEQEVHDAIITGLREYSARPASLARIPFTPAQVVSSDPTTGTSVQFDTDAAAQAVPIQTVLGATAGQRGLVMHTPDGGAYFLPFGGVVGGTVGPPVTTGALLGSTDNTVIAPTSLTMYKAPAEWDLRRDDGVVGAPAPVGGGEPVGISGYGVQTGTGFSLIAAVEGHTVGSANAASGPTGGFSLYAISTVPGSVPQPTGQSVGIDSSTPIDVPNVTTDGYVSGTNPTAGTGALTEHMRVSSGYVAVDPNQQFGSMGDLTGATTVAFATTAGSTTITAPVGTFTGDFVGRTVAFSPQTAHPIWPFPATTTVLSVAPDGATATLADAANAAVAIAVGRFGRWANIDSSMLRTPNLFLAQHLDVRQPTTDMWAATVARISLDRTMTADFTIQAPTAIPGPAGLIQIDGTYRAGTNLPMRDAWGGPTFNCSRVYTNIDGEDAFPGGVLNGYVTTETFVAMNGDFSISNAWSHTPNESFWAGTGNSMYVGFYMAMGTGNVVTVGPSFLYGTGARAELGINFDFWAQPFGISGRSLTLTLTQGSQTVIATAGTFLPTDQDVGIIGTVPIAFFRGMGPGLAPGTTVTYVDATHGQLSIPANYTGSLQVFVGAKVDQAIGFDYGMGNLLNRTIPFAKAVAGSDEVTAYTDGSYSTPDTSAFQPDDVGALVANWGKAVAGFGTKGFIVAVSKDGFGTGSTIRLNVPNTVGKTGALTFSSNWRLPHYGVRRNIAFRAAGELSFYPSDVETLTNQDRIRFDATPYFITSTGSHDYYFAAGLGPLIHNASTSRFGVTAGGGFSFTYNDISRYSNLPGVTNIIYGTLTAINLQRTYFAEAASGNLTGNANELWIHPTFTTTSTGTLHWGAWTGIQIDAPAISANASIQSVTGISVFDEFTVARFPNNSAGTTLFFPHASYPTTDGGTMASGWQIRGPSHIQIWAQCTDPVVTQGTTRSVGVPVVRTTQADAHLTAGSAVITSASAAFSAATDLDAVPSGVSGLLDPYNNALYIVSVQSATQATLNAPFGGTTTTTATLTITRWTGTYQDGDMTITVPGGGLTQADVGRYMTTRSGNATFPFGTLVHTPDYVRAYIQAVSADGTVATLTTPASALAGVADGCTMTQTQFAIISTERRVALHVHTDEYIEAPAGANVTNWASVGGFALTANRGPRGWIQMDGTTVFGNDRAADGLGIPMQTANIFTNKLGIDLTAGLGICGVAFSNQLNSNPGTGARAYPIQIGSGGATGTVFNDNWSFTSVDGLTNAAQWHSFEAGVLFDNTLWADFDILVGGAHLIFGSALVNQRLVHVKNANRDHKTSAGVTVQGSNRIYTPVDFFSVGDDTGAQINGIAAFGVVVCFPPGTQIATVVNPREAILRGVSAISSTGRYIGNGTTTSGSPTISSPSGFTTADLHQSIEGDGIPANTFIGAVSGNTASLSSSASSNVPRNATGTFTGNARFYVNANAQFTVFSSLNAGPNSLGNLIGIDIDYLNTGLNNIGIRNASTTVYPPLLQAASTATGISPSSTYVELVAPGTGTIVLPNPNIATNGILDGQVLKVGNQGPAAVRFTNGQGVFLGTLAFIDLAPGESLTFTWIGGFTGWRVDQALALSSVASLGGGTNQWEDQQLLAWRTALGHYQDRPAKVAIIGDSLFEFGAGETFGAELMARYSSSQPRPWQTYGGFNCAAAFNTWAIDGTGTIDTTRGAVGRVVTLNAGDKAVVVGAIADPIKISGITWAGGTATVTTTAAHGITATEVVEIVDVTPSGYEGKFTVATTPTTTTFTYALANNPGTYVRNGWVSHPANVPRIEFGDRLRIHYSHDSTGKFCPVIDGVPQVKRITVTTATTTAGSPIVTAPGANFTNADLHMPISGDGIPKHAYIGHVTSTTQIELSSSTTANVAFNATTSRPGNATVVVGAAWDTTAGTNDISLALIESQTAASQMELLGFGFTDDVVGSLVEDVGGGAPHLQNGTRIVGFDPATFALQVNLKPLLKTSFNGKIHRNAWTSPQLAHGQHTMELVCVSGTCKIDGSYWYNGNYTSGVQVHMLAHSGFLTSDMLALNGVSPGTFSNIPSIAFPDQLNYLVDEGFDLVIFATGTNDGSTANYQSWMGQLIPTVQFGLSGQYGWTYSTATPPTSRPLVSTCIWLPEPKSGHAFMADLPPIAQQIASTTHSVLADMNTLAYDHDVLSLGQALSLLGSPDSPYTLTSDGTHYTTAGARLASSVLLETVDGTPRNEDTWQSFRSDLGGYVAPFYEASSASTGVGYFQSTLAGNPSVFIGNWGFVAGLFAGDPTALGISPDTLLYRSAASQWNMSGSSLVGVGALRMSDWLITNTFWGMGPTGDFTAHGGLFAAGLAVQIPIGGTLLTLTSSGAAGSAPTETVFQNKVTTTTNAQTTVATVAVSTAATYMIEAHVVGRRTDATNTGDAIGSVVLATVKGGGAPALVGSVASLGQPNTAMAANFFAMQQQSNTWLAGTTYVTITISGTNALVRVTGATGATVVWAATVRVWSVTN